MVPVGHVMYELNQRMKAGQVSGYTHIKQLFADGIHLNNVGSYVVGCTYFATLYKENPKGLPGEPYKVMDPKLAEVIQETVWKVVSTYELAGVATSLRVGMPLRGALEALSASGAKETEMAMAPPKSKHGGYMTLKCFDLPNGRMLCLVADKVADLDDKVIVELSVCENPSQPVAMREWKTAESLSIKQP